MGLLANIALDPDTFPYFLAIERDLVVVASADPSLSKLVANVVADVYGMNALG